MTFQEKSLYHQIHPLKLITDWGTGIAALYPFWQHNLVPALLLAFIPSLAVSFALIRYAHLESYQRSAFGKYVRQYMTRSMQIIRMAGYILMAIGAWTHIIWLMPVGLLVILFAWLRGAILPNPS